MKFFQYALKQYPKKLDELNKRTNWNESLDSFLHQNCELIKSMYVKGGGKKCNFKFNSQILIQKEFTIIFIPYYGYTLEIDNEKIMGVQHIIKKLHTIINSI